MADSSKKFLPFIAFKFGLHDYLVNEKKKLDYLVKRHCQVTSECFGLQSKASPTSSD
jgi:hypothetical protein